MRAVAFHPEAEAEFLAAARYYEAQAENLGFDFVSAVERTYQRLAAFPKSGHPFGARLRRALVPEFPSALSTAPSRSDCSSCPSQVLEGAPHNKALQLAAVFGAVPESGSLRSWVRRFGAVPAPWPELAG